MALKNELVGLRGSWLYRKAKHGLAHVVGRAFWFDHLSASIDYAMQRHTDRGRPLVYYEFGTGSGNTLQRAISVLKHYPDAQIVLFDSFEGLPPAASDRDKLRGWNAGDFAFSEDYIRAIVERNGFPMSRLRMVKGFFEDSLTDALREELRSMPPSFVTVDVDYYSSTRTVLEFLKPMLVSGATFYFDDLWSFDGHPEFGQIKAVTEFNASCTRGQLTPNPIFWNRIYSYYNHDYEFVNASS